MNRCQNCKFWALWDSGYSNYTVLETTVYCLKKHFEPIEESYSWNNNPNHEFLKQAETCVDFKKEEGVQITYDVAGYVTIEDYKDDLEVYNAAKEYPLTNKD